LAGPEEFETDNLEELEHENHASVSVN
jgi:hypothetical protein